MKVHFPDKKVGILGGGQLARMMVLQGHNLGLEVHVYSENSGDPAAQVTKHWHQGSLNNKTKLAKFISEMNVTTFESEFLDSKLLSEVLSEGKGTILPRPSTMEQLQDRLSQKNQLVKNKIPTADFIEWKKSHTWAAMSTKFPNGFVIKQRRNGYDGYGTFIIKRKKDYEEFCQRPPDEFGYIAEELIPFKRELSIICARNKRGDLVFYPLVESLQKASRCFWVKGPISHKLESKLQRNLRVFLNRIHYVGVIAFELFDTGKELIVNEVAPRVHNTGHHSLDSMEVDQFTCHLHSILNCKLTPPKTISKGFAMVNLLGRSHKKPTWELPKGSQLHWYGKSENRPGRKMGHINVISNSGQNALKQALKAEKEFSL